MLTRSAVLGGQDAFDDDMAGETAEEYAGRALRQDSLAVACCQTWQVSPGLLSDGAAS